MEDEGCRCGCEGGAQASVYLQDLHPPHLRRRETRTRRMAQILAVVLLLAVSALSALVFVLLSGRHCHPPHHNQTQEQPDRHPLGADGRQNGLRMPSDQDRIPRAFFTASTGNITNGKYLQWDSQLGQAYCEGFNYSNGDVVVLRDGFYRVSLQVSFEGDGHGCLVLMHNITVLYFHDSYDAERQLLSSYDTVVCSNTTWRKTLYTSGAFKLLKNAILRVTSNYPNLILKNEHQLFFQIELLTNA